MRLRRILPAAAAAALLAPAATAAHGRDLHGRWSDDATGSGGAARLVLGAKPHLRLDGAFGCVGATVLRVSYRGGRLGGSGAVACNRGLRWSIAGPPASASVRIRLADGSRAVLSLVLQP